MNPAQIAGQFFPDWDEPRPYGGSPRVFFLSGCAIPSRQTVIDKRDRGPTFL